RVTAGAEARMAAIRILMRTAPLWATLAALAWALSTNPFAAPLVQRTGQDLALALEREVRRTATPDWTEAALAQAVAAEDIDRTAMLVALAGDLGHDLDTRAAQALLDAQGGWQATATTCAICMADIATCPSVKMLGACAVPFEMSPLGDLNALRRAGLAWWDEDEIDRLDAGLALLGLGATGAAVATGGSSLAVKAGAGTIRMARRLGTLTPGLARMLDVTDAAKRPALQAVAADLGRVRGATSAGDALRLMRHVDGPEDARHLARIAEAAGPRTVRTFDVLGKSRTIRASLRLTRAALATAALIWLAIVQVAITFATRTGAALLRAAATPGPISIVPDTGGRPTSRKSGATRSSPSNRTPPLRVPARPPSLREPVLTRR
ncbi:MAG: hypothetical protein AAF264_11625, partial [Pseudomonadota bacterium]